MGHHPVRAGPTIACWRSAISRGIRCVPLGPAERNLREFDCWRQQELHGRFLCVLHTDGIGRGMGGKPLRLLDEMEELRGAGENAARRFIERAIEDRPQDFDDNLTLAVIEGE